MYISQSTNDALTSASTVSRSGHMIRPRTVFFAIGLSPLKKLHGEEKYGDEERSPGSQSFSHAWRLGSWSRPSPSTFSLPSFKLTLGCLDLEMHLVCPFLQTLLICFAVVHNLVLELFLEVLLLLGSEVRHSSVEVLRLLLFVLEPLYFFCACLPTLQTFVASRLASCSRALDPSGFHPCLRPSRRSPELRQPCFSSPRFVWLTVIELHGTLLRERRCPCLQGHSCLSQEERWSWSCLCLRRDVCLRLMGLASLWPGE